MIPVRPRIGVLALQGGVFEHIRMLEQLAVEAIPVRLPEHLNDIHALVLPGGESTTLIALLARWDLVEPIKKLAVAGIPILGTCAGAVLMTTEVSEQEHELVQESFGLIEANAVRNRFGRQSSSFQEMLCIDGLDEPYPGVFIRAPLLLPTSDRVQVLSSVDEGPVFLRQGCIWLSSFHPELTADTRVHSLFLKESGITIRNDVFACSGNLHGKG